jgi:hypothetical protein
MKETILSAFFIGLILGCIFMGLLITYLVTIPRQEEAIKRGYAEMKLRTPISKEAVFTWK